MSPFFKRGFKGIAYLRISSKSFDDIPARKGWVWKPDRGGMEAVIDQSAKVEYELWSADDRGRDVSCYLAGC
jgi:hypothetical protein